MRRVVLGVLCAGLAGLTASDSTHAQGKGDWTFQRVGTFANYRNVVDADGGVDTSQRTISEIVAATADGMTLVYTDGERDAIGFIDITNPAQPKAAGSVLLDPDPRDSIPYSPTSVAVLRNQYALVAVDNTPPAGTALSVPAGRLLVIDLATRAVVRDLPLGGQPDSVAISPDHRFIAVAIENQRNESHVPTGGSAGELPQLPAGYLAVIATKGAPASWVRTDVDLTGLADIAPGDPEPEFVDINQANEAVVTLQENNHIVIVDLPSRQVVADFPAGTVDLNGVDAADDGVIAQDDTLDQVRREPDAVTWLGGDHLVTANEGDYGGGSRGFTIFRRDGTVTYDSGSSLEQLAVRFGHYPEGRSDDKGVEPESVATAKFGPEDYLFVGSERGGFVAVFRLDRAGQPVFSQWLPAPLRPEGLLTIPHRNLLVAAGESDARPFGVRSTVMIYALGSGAPTAPQVESADDSTTGLPIPWSALSGLTEVPGRSDTVQAVWDSYYRESRIFTIDVSKAPALVTSALTLTTAGGAPMTGLDPEGLAYAPDGTIWVASEGNETDTRSNRLLQVDAQTGAILQTVPLPAAVLACRAAERTRTATPPRTTGTFGSGFEGLDVVSENGTTAIYIAQQRGWNYNAASAAVGGAPSNCEDLDDDPTNTNPAEPAWSRLWKYTPSTGTWSSIAWQLTPRSNPTQQTWVGLSEVTRVEGGWILIERDNRTGDFGVLKTLVHVEDAALADGKVENSEKQVFDLRPSLLANNGWITDKPEGVAVLDGQLYVVTDNDGVDGWSGETWFLRLGRWIDLFN